MTKPKRTLLIILLVSGGLVLIYRYRLINAVQQMLIRSVSDRAFVDNRRFLYDSAFSHHRIYMLKGIDRLWPHRVNSLRRFRYLYPEFAGFECDIQFVPGGAGALSLGHDSPGPDLFTDLLHEDADRRKLFWMDLKNIGKENVGPFCDLLDRLDRQYAIRDRIFLECYDTLTALAVKSRGFLTGLNIYWIQVAPDERSKALPALFPGKIGLLSAEYPQGSPFIGELPGAKQLTWDIHFRDGMDRSTLLQLANDTSMLVCLINVKSPGYR